METGKKDKHVSTNSSASTKPSPVTINEFPVELLSRIFELGRGMDENRYCEDAELRYWDGFMFHSLHPQINDDTRMAEIEQVEESPDNPDNDAYSENGDQGEDGKEDEMIVEEDFHPPPTFRIAVSHVCRLWRQVAFSTPSLWTTITVPTVGCSFEFTRTLLPRSGALSLDLDIREDVEDMFSESKPEKVKNFTALFEASAPRLRSIALSRRLDWSQRWISSLPNLTTLELRIHKADFRPSWEQFAALLRGAPALMKLVISNSGPRSYPDEPIGDPAIDEATRMANMSIQLLNLTELAIGQESANRIIALFHAIYMPALKSLSIRLESGSNRLMQALPILPLHPATDEVSPPRLFNKLEYLQLSSDIRVVFHALELTKKLYDELLSLKSLQVFLPRIGNAALLKILHPDTSTGRVRIPPLKTLILRWPLPELGDIQELVQKRKDAGFPLETLYLQRSFPGDPPRDADLSWLRENLATVSFLSGVIGESL